MLSKGKVSRLWMLGSIRDRPLLWQMSLAFPHELKKLEMKSIGQLWDLKAGELEFES